MAVFRWSMSAARAGRFGSFVSASVKKGFVVAFERFVAQRAEGVAQRSVRGGRVIIRPISGHPARRRWRTNECGNEQNGFDVISIRMCVNSLGTRGSALVCYRDATNGQARFRQLKLRGVHALRPHRVAEALQCVTRGNLVPDALVDVLSGARAAGAAHSRVRL